MRTLAACPLDHALSNQALDWHGCLEIYLSRATAVSFDAGAERFGRRCPVVRMRDGQQSELLSVSAVVGSGRRLHPGVIPDE